MQSIPLRTHIFLQPGVVKLTVSYECEDSTHEGLFNNLLFKDYIDPQTGEPVGDKPHVQHAVDSLRNLFSKNGDITFYVRDEEDGFQSEIEILYDAMDVELVGAYCLCWKVLLHLQGTPSEIL